MRLLYLTDTHIRSGNPRNRRDDFPAALRAKLLEVAGLVRKLGVFAVLHGGDFFDQPCPELPVVGEFVRIFRDMGVPVYVVPGNHDIFACNPDTLEHTVLGLLHQVGCLRVLQAGEKLYLKDGRVTVQLTGTPFHYNIDRQDPLLDYCVTKENCDFAIHLAHGMLLDRPFLPGTPYTLISQIAPFTEADYTLGSHAHFGYPDVEWDGRRFINPGALVRLSVQPPDRKRTPQVLLLDFSGPKPTHRKIPLRSARPGAEVLKPGPLAVLVQREAGRLPSGEADQHADQPDCPYFSEILEEVARRGSFPPAVTQEALRLLSCTREPDRSGPPVWLRRLVLENFQSHAYTELELASGLNVILGESNQGKSAIVRALRWLLCDDLPAYGFLRKGSSFVRITGMFDNQKVISREWSPHGVSGSVAGRTARSALLPQLELADGIRLCLHIAAEREEPFLLSLSDTLKACAIDHLSGAPLFEAAVRETEDRVRPVGPGAPETGGVELQKQVEALLTLAAVHARETICSRIEDIVNQALASVFQPPPQFKVLFDDYAVSPRAEFLVYTASDGAYPYHAAHEGFGGGVVDVISLALRVAFLELVHPPLTGPLVLDEPLKQVSNRFTAHLARLLKTFADHYGRQIIVVTHNQHLAGTADAVYVLRLESGSSVLYRRGSSIRASSKHVKCPN